MSAADGKIIREALKAAGYNRTRVGVTSESFSMGSSVTVTIKDPTVDFEEVERIANTRESIRRCEYSGEILSGGNTYIHVYTTKEVDEALAAPYVEACAAAYAQIEGNTLIPVEGTTVLLGHDGAPHNVSVWLDGFQGITWTDGEDFHSVALKVARVIKAAEKEGEPVVE